MWPGCLACLIFIPALPVTLALWAVPGCPESSKLTLKFRCLANAFKVKVSFRVLLTSPSFRLEYSLLTHEFEKACTKYFKMYYPTFLVVFNGLVRQREKFSISIPFSTLKSRPFLCNIKHYCWWASWAGCSLCVPPFYVQLFLKRRMTSQRSSRQPSKK